MPTQEAILTVILVAIVANLIVAVGLLVGPRFRRRSTTTTARRSISASCSGRRRPAGRPTWATKGNPAATCGTPSERRCRVRRWPPAAADPTIAMATAAGGEPGGSDQAPAPSGDTGVGADPESGPDADPSDAPVTDLTTGLDSPATWAKWLTEENARVQRYGRPATIVLVELAGLDRLAERLGSAAADRLIPPIATTMRRHARSADNLARLGPSRFAALMPDTDEIKAINYVERVRSACDVWLEAGAVSLRLSIGWAEINANQTVDPAVQAAERRLNEERARYRTRDIADLDPDRNLGISQMRAAPAN